MDLDHFKSINDTYGHIVGDQYLQQLSAILGEVSTASAFRFGGDEFCLLFCGCSRSWVQQICTMIKDRFLETPLCQEVTQATLSFGAAVYQRDFSTAKLVRQADSALYRAKQNRGSLCFYDELQK
jgi:diguanylate cyclase